MWCALHISTHTCVVPLQPPCPSHGDTLESILSRSSIVPGPVFATLSAAADQAAGLPAGHTLRCYWVQSVLSAEAGGWTQPGVGDGLTAEAAQLDAAREPANKLGQQTAEGSQLGPTPPHLVVFKSDTVILLLCPECMGATECGGQEREYQQWASHCSHSRHR